MEGGAVDHRESVDELESFTRHIDELSRSLITARRPAYEVGIDIWSAAMGGLRSVDSVAHPLWLIWGSLTDLIDGPDGAMPDAREKAAALMLRAASEWLSMPPELRGEYFDRCVYVHCGYERPSQT